MVGSDQNRRAGHLCLAGPSTEVAKLEKIVISRQVEYIVIVVPEAGYFGQPEPIALPKQGAEGTNGPEDQGEWIATTRGPKATPQRQTPLVEVANSFSSLEEAEDNDIESKLRAEGPADGMSCRGPRLDYPPLSHWREQRVNRLGTASPPPGLPRTTTTSATRRGTWAVRVQ